ncbi:hypothetical protein LNU06_00080 [Campylobacter sp. VicNov18]|uniref:hypothetical protein n=1 Tax=Campylobacter bilis TaxID=2691918 RepID=UPI00130D6B09|nr:hypothetical protein [Campylobacter bilis]MPV62942.1 hypothetical protein [Campylobacter hepaticus]MBM0636441.1 hypothetical protein [Campylobacter bilis]MCC8277150.1 hypothetical protein [Campylobacter bilis]MCC8298893.1 hypothetical protein [Campylobacter bilis]MCC8300059.1 hypothetical protein [Campylobacter bilis]
MTINLTNPYENLSLNHTLKNNCVFNVTQNNTIFNLNEQKYHHNTTYASEFGFRINEEGFFDKDLNKIAYIPQTYDIHIKSIRMIAKELARQDENLKYNKIDLPYLLNSYYSSLKSINLEFYQEDNAYLNRDLISKLLAGFSSDNGEFLGPIARIYENQEEMDFALSNITNLNTLMLDNKIINFHFDKAIKNTSTNTILKPYLNQNAEVSKAGLLMNFIYHDIKTQNDKEFNSFIKASNLDLKAHQNLQKILKGEINIEDYIKENNEKKMSFDLYLYVNGIDKKTSTQDKLSIFFQQYINYQKDMDLKQIMDSSSIFEMYIEENRNDFDFLKKEYQSQSQDKKRLKKADQIRLDSMEFFLDHRQKQANVNKILTSYLSVMA